MAGAFSPLATCDCPGCGQPTTKVTVTQGSGARPASKKIMGVPTWVIASGVVAVGLYLIHKSRKRRSRK